MISQLKLTNFRTHRKLAVEFADKVNIITGNNGVGKTSLIEAIYIGGVGSSWRSSLAAITNYQADWWRADILEDKNTKTIKYDSAKQFVIGGRAYARLPRKYQQAIVLFEPDDLNLLYGSPSRRRRWLDKLLKDIDPKYGATINKFQKVLAQRNALLKTAADPDKLFVWDLQFADLAAEIIARRQEMIAQIQQQLPDEFRKISRQADKITLKYQSDNAKTKQAILDQLHINYPKDKLIGSTSIGPQKHDIELRFQNQPAADTASRGENRSIILSLKNIEYQLKTNHVKPLILLDDIMSELDENHQANLLKSFQDSQVIITSVNQPKITKTAKIITLK